MKTGNEINLSLIRLLLFTCFTLAILNLKADILQVPANYSTISAAIAASSPGDTVLVYPGIYNGCNCYDANVTIGSLTMMTGDSSYIGQTIVQRNSGSVFYFDTFDVGFSTVELNGLTLRNGTGTWNPDFFNDSLYHGGGICVYLGEVHLKNMVIRNNSADCGGGIGCIFGSVTAENVHIYDNYATMVGGGIHCIQTCGVFSRTNITNNTSVNAGGGLMLWATDTEMVNCKIMGNQASYGGGLYSYDTFQVELTDCLVAGNIANVEGGGAYVKYSFRENGPDDFISTVLINSTVVGNIAPLAGGMWNQTITEIYNSIFWDNEPEQLLNAGTLSVYFSDFEGGFAGIPNYGIISEYLENIEENPEFGDIPTGDYSLKRISPCINTGKPDTIFPSLPVFDLAAKTRIVRDTVDMGAYEFQFTRALDLKVFLEGPFNATAGNMYNHLYSEGYLPSEQPFHVVLPWYGNPDPVWYYEGEEKANSIVNSEIVDWILVEIKETQWSNDSAFWAPSRTQQKAGFLLQDGAVVSPDGQSFIEFTDPEYDSVYISIYHMNHLAVMSNYSIHINDELFSYDFTDNAGKAYQFTSGSPPVFVPGHKEIAPGVYGLYAADGNADMIVNDIDKVLLWNMEAGETGYLPADYNRDGFVNNRDKNDCWLGNSGVGTDREE